MGGMSVTELAVLAGVCRMSVNNAIHTKGTSEKLCKLLAPITQPHITAEDWFTLSPSKKKKAFEKFKKEYARDNLRAFDKAIKN